MKNEDTVENSYEPDMLMSPVEYAANCQRYATRELFREDKKVLILNFSKYGKCTKSLLKMRSSNFFDIEVIYLI